MFMGCIGPWRAVWHLGFRVEGGLAGSRVLLAQMTVVSQRDVMHGENIWKAVKLGNSQTAFVLSSPSF